MNLESHLQELVRKHEALKAEIAEASAHPSADDIEVTTLKKRKLRLKEEIERWKRRAA